MTVVHQQCDQISRWFVQFWLFIKQKICPIAYQIYQSESKILREYKIYSQNIAKDL